MTAKEATERKRNLPRLTIRRMQPITVWKTWESEASDHIAFSQKPDKKRTEPH